MVVQPWVTDSIKTRFYIPFQNPLCRSLSYQHVEALRNGIGGAALGSKPVRVRIRESFRDRFQCEELQGLHRSVAQGGNPQRSEFAVLLRNINSPRRLWAVAPPS